RRAGVLGRRRRLQQALDRERERAAGGGVGDLIPGGGVEDDLRVQRVDVDRRERGTERDVEQVVAGGGPLGLDRRDVARRHRPVERILDAWPARRIAAGGGGAEPPVGAGGRAGHRRRAGQ